MKSTDTKSLSPAGEAILRYCPHVQKNVVMLVTRSENDTCFECMHRATCSHPGGKLCASQKNETK